MSNPITQDWKEVVLHGKNKQKKNTEAVKKNNGGKHGSSSLEYSIKARKLEEQEIGHIETVSRDLSLTIQQARLDKKLKQADLAKALSMPLDKIQKYENGKAEPNNQELQKMSKILGVILKKNPKKKENK